MNSLGKIADIFIMILVMFIFPVTWALTRSSIQSGEELAIIARDFMERTDSCKYLDAAFLELCCGKIGNRGDYHAQVTTIRRADGFNERVFNESLEELDSGDVVILRISDRKSTVCSYIKVIT